MPLLSFPPSPPLVIPDVSNRESIRTPPSTEAESHHIRQFESISSHQWLVAGAWSLATAHWPLLTDGWSCLSLKFFGGILATGLSVTAQAGRRPSPQPLSRGGRGVALPVIPDIFYRESSAPICFIHVQRNKKTPAHYRPPGILERCQANAA